MVGAPRQASGEGLPCSRLTHCTTTARHRVWQRAHLQILLRLAQVSSLLLGVPFTSVFALQLPLQVFDAALQLDALEEADLQNDGLSRHCG